jgi:two-component system chemotaxis response regulator CheB
VVWDTGSSGSSIAALKNRLLSSEKLIIVGASTGGTEAIKEFLMQMPPDCPAS